MSDVAEPPADTKPLSPWYVKRPPWLFTPESARAANERKKALAQHETEPQTEIDGYAARILARVREQVDAIDIALSKALEAKEVDPQAVERLSRAAVALSDRERKLAGRPDPGTYRPTARRSPRGSASVEPI